MLARHFRLIRWYNPRTSRPVLVNRAPPPPLVPPRNASTSGLRKHWFIVRISVHARMYDIPNWAAAWVIEPLCSNASSNSALPGPSAISSPQAIRNRGRKVNKWSGFGFRAMLEISQQPRRDATVNNIRETRFFIARMPWTAVLTPALEFDPSTKESPPGPPALNF